MHSNARVCCIKQISELLGWKLSPESLWIFLNFFIFIIFATMPQVDHLYPLYENLLTFWRLPEVEFSRLFWNKEERGFLKVSQNLTTNIIIFVLHSLREAEESWCLKLRSVF